ncbi:hypothetical protein [Micromonospora auratinigra]|uniref:Uncharacterized protein n=1 Tax=Micromonospora auratinigra TaxID=261654 RepID=A0A1A9A332_9ACTN|nr:hypothetical protein [Micromonospora auratinigra]SBT50535.1 hypothetical protein GA0070611_4806 [Micromonospora auratinigra]
MDDPLAVAGLVRDLIGRRLLAVTEARYWYEGQRGGDAASLLDFWLHFEGRPTLMAHGCGEHLRLELTDPYPSYDMQEDGETRVGPAREPDLLATFVGRRLLDASLVRGYTTVPSVGGLRLRFERGDLMVASLADQWVLRHGPVPTDLRQYLAVGSWLGAEDDGGRPTRNPKADPW